MIKKTIKQSLNDIIYYWNLEFSNSYPLTERLVEEKLINSVHIENEGTYSLYLDETYVATIVLKFCKKDYPMYLDTAYISFIFVNPKFRQKGYGSLLVNEAKTIAINHKKSVLKIGSDFENLFSGLFVKDNEYAHRFFKKHFKQTYTNYNLIGNTRPHFEKDDYTYKILDTIKEKEELLIFLKTHFSYRWYDDALDVNLEEFVIVKEYNHIIGFVRICHPKCKSLANSINLYPLYDYLGGIGPLGIDPTKRGLKIGSNMVKYAMNYLFDLNCSNIIVDWTGLVNFYKHCGFEEISNIYIQYEQKL